MRTTLCAQTTHGVRAAMQASASRTTRTRTTTTSATAATTMSTRTTVASSNVLASGASDKRHAGVARAPRRDLPADLETDTVLEWRNLQNK